MKKALLIVLAVMLACASIAAFAAPKTASDTPTATDITAQGTQNSLDYNNSGGVAQSTVNTTDITVTVMPMYGFSGLNAPADQTTTPDVPVSYLYVITNEGNDSDTYALAKSSFTYSGAGVEMAAQIMNPTATAEISSISLGEDATGTFLVKVTPNPSLAPNGSWGKVSVTASTASTPVGQYTGANGNDYGGVAIATDETQTNIEAAVMTMTRTATVDAPTQYIANKGGGEHDPVPGAVVTYRIVYTNTGAGNALSAVIIDKVPTNTTGLHRGKTGSDVANVTITDAGENANGAAWSVAYSLNNGGSYTTLGTGKQTIPANATHVKFTKALVTPAETGTITWGVTIK